jgi:hypothetical protein
MRIRRNNVTIYDDPIARVLTRMDECWEKDVEEYAKLVALLGKLTEMKDKSCRFTESEPGPSSGTAEQLRNGRPAHAARETQRDHVESR